MSDLGSGEGSAPTHLEETAGSAPTHLEDTAGSAPTRHEVDPRGPVAHAGSSLLPEELRASYSVIGQRLSGGEGILFDVIETRTEEYRILKLYNTDVRLQPEALRRIQTIDRDHVVRLVAFGQIADGRWYEVQERVEGGSLDDYRQTVGGDADPKAD